MFTMFMIFLSLLRILMNFDFAILAPKALFSICVVAKSLKRSKISHKRNLLKDSESEETSEDILTEVNDDVMIVFI